MGPAEKKKYIRHDDATAARLYVVVAMTPKYVEQTMELAFKQYLVFRSNIHWDFNWMIDIISFV